MKCIWIFFKPLNSPLLVLASPLTELDWKQEQREDVPDLQTEFKAVFSSGQNLAQLTQSGSPVRYWLSPYQ